MSSTTRRSPAASSRTWPSEARFAPAVSASAGRKQGNAGIGHGNRYLARVLGEVAVGRSILMIVWALLSDADAHYIDLGSGYYDFRTTPQRRVRNHVRELRAPGYTVILNAAA